MVERVVVVVVVGLVVRIGWWMDATRRGAVD